MSANGAAPGLAAPVDAPRRAALQRAFLARDMGAADALLATLPGALARLRLEIVDNARAAEAAPVWRAEPGGDSRFRFHRKTWAQHPGEIFGRWLDMLPLIAAVLDARPIGSCILNLGDEGHRPGLAFDGQGPGLILIPDCLFMATGGYADLARLFAERERPWEQRRPVAFWRGTTTGYAPEIGALPRVRLCRVARAMGARADIGLSSVTARFATAEPALRAEGLLRPFVPNDRLDTVQVHVDIDGNSSSWPGLLGKLHSGSPVLKVASPQGFRQWYYHRLTPWEHYVPVRADMADLDEKAAMLLAEPALARAIGAAGQRLARTLDYPGEVARAVPVALRAFER